jgi:ferric-dicitrate binding protein FerR (iron transport regulator)
MSLVIRKDLIMEKQQLARLAQKYLDGTASEQEIRLLHDWYDTTDEDEVERVFTQGEHESGEDIKGRILSGLQRAIHSNDAEKKIKFGRAAKWMAAASVILIMILSAATWFSLRRPADKQMAVDHQKEAFQTVVTPRGGQYRLVLPDGSKVWLNASSSLKFPRSFNGKQRQVVLTGEAYFEVAKNAAMPFEVAVNDMRVEVLGTHFNIMSYKEEESINTTLLEGSVRVRMGAAGNLLRPGEQASLYKTTEKISVSGVDVDQAIAWKNGLFLFEGATIESVMKEIARWYDVDVVYKGKFSQHFRGMISRSVNISQVIKMLELTSEAHFKIDGRTITVMP